MSESKNLCVKGKQSRLLFWCRFSLYAYLVSLDIYFYVPFVVAYFWKIYNSIRVVIFLLNIGGPEMKDIKC